MTRVCNICLQDLPIEKFARNRSRTEGREFHCLKCAGKRVKAWRAKKKLEAANGNG